jgi:hypothetical protein
MSMSQEDRFGQAGRLMTMRIIHGALLAGSAAFAGLAIYIRSRGDQPIAEPPIISYVGVIFAATTLIAFLVVPNIMAANFRTCVAAGLNPLPVSYTRGGRPAQPQILEGNALWWALYQIRLIVMAALLEGTIFLQLIAYLLEGIGWSLGLALLFWLSLALLFPTRERVETWARTQQNLVEQQRNSGPSD